MCGIVGYISQEKLSEIEQKQLHIAVNAIKHRGPDYRKVEVFNNVGLAHARLSIIDTSEKAHQPFHSSTGEYTIVFNGEIYNFNSIKEQLKKEFGYTFKTSSDTEVLLYAYMAYKEKCLDLLDGFFAFAVYHHPSKSLFLARDRFGIKPLFYAVADNRFFFGSELRAVMPFLPEREIDKISLFTYLQLNYIPGAHTILNKVKKLLPGHYIIIPNCENPEEFNQECYYTIDVPKESTLVKSFDNYQKAKEVLYDLLHQSVKNRLISDVPIGTFLSGGIDSSVISLIASKYHSGLNTFSVGYADNPYFDETNYAELVAKKIGSNHHTFKLTTQELAAGAQQVLNAIDEPFADSSEIAVYLLTKYTRKHITVALSGDGADEIFSGYRKHQAEYLARHRGMSEKLIALGYPIWKNLPKSRNGKFSDTIRKLYKFSQGMQLTPKQRYWRWATLISEEKANYLLKEKQIITEQRLTDGAFSYKKRKDALLKNITKDGDFNEVLLTDVKMLLPGDMLTKVDMMSMANSLEVRVPFLNHRLVEFAFALPEAFKINRNLKKKILQDTFKDELPEALYNRPKKGFEVPLAHLLKTDLHPLVEEYLGKSFIEQQNLFNPTAINELYKQLHSNNPNDAPATVWAILVFNFWWKNSFLQSSFNT